MKKVIDYNNLPISRILFLDDERNPEDVTWVVYPENAEFTVVRNRLQFQYAVLSNRRFDIFSLDHDLQDFDPFTHKENTGYSLLCEVMRLNPSKMPKTTVIAHSKNPVGAKNIEKAWKFFKENEWRL